MDFFVENNSSIILPVVVLYISYEKTNQEV